MDKKTEALEMAQELRALADRFSEGWHEGIKIDALDIELLAMAASAIEQPAQQQEPVSLPEKIYEFVPTPEPVKWHHPECEGQCIACLIEQVVQEAYGSQGLGYLQRHLTSPPAQRKPLTLPQIAKALADAGLRPEDYREDGMIEPLVRAIEAAHGIKGDA